ncbi:MAG: ribose 5-phosphate isomerase B [Vallitaleaceae bacterium]|jgi:ribose 5-phosphate isomerase B|nr:ribose 5-phosphate isomerase B [Vallitaleaceae bacterium]
MIAIGSDHGGFELKETIIAYLKERQIAYKDYGTYSLESVDYPDYAKEVGKAIQKGECDKGILICSTGIGISITANKMKGIRAALCHDCFSAQATRDHNNANVLAMGALVIGKGLALKIVETFIDTPFSNEDRHVRRVNKIEEEA